MLDEIGHHHQIHVPPGQRCRSVLNKDVQDAHVIEAQAPGRTHSFQADVNALAHTGAATQAGMQPATIGDALGDQRHMVCKADMQHPATS